MRGLPEEFDSRRSTVVFAKRAVKLRAAISGV
jgi:hypothetical protein